MLCANRARRGRPWARWGRGRGGRAHSAPRTEAALGRDAAPPQTSLPGPGASLRRRDAGLRGARRSCPYGRAPWPEGREGRRGGPACGPCGRAAGRAGPQSENVPACSVGWRPRVGPAAWCGPRAADGGAVWVLSSGADRASLAESCLRVRRRLRGGGPSAQPFLTARIPFALFSPHCPSDSHVLHACIS